MEIKKLFEEDKDRVNKCTHTISLDAKHFLYFDFSKTHVTDQDLDNMLKKLNQLNLQNKIKDMFDGKKINYTENKQVLHVLLRDKEILDALCENERNQTDKIKSKNCDLNDTKCNLEDIKTTIYDELIKMKNFSKDLREGKMLGATGQKIDTVVNIGIGGSDLGPKFVCDALKYYADGLIQVDFISNIDATATVEVFKKINPEKTLFIVVSKTFTTLETLKNMELCYKYMVKAINKERSCIFKHHFVAVSANTDEVKKYKIENIFDMWDFVGGRYSLWSAVGLSICCYLGFDNFYKLLKGASIVDENFKKMSNMNTTIIHAMVELYYSNINFNNKCIVTYDQYLEKMYLYLQQAEMESNGKYSKETNTGMIIWGGVGTDVQHSFFQLLHQGTREILTEFLFPFESLHNEKEYHNMLLSNCFAQSMALMEGKRSKNENDNFLGNKPSITIGYSKLCPITLGALIAHYEHKIFVQGIYWEINSFDQFGVTLGKKIATNVLKSFENKINEEFDPSTAKLLQKVWDLEK